MREWIPTTQALILNLDTTIEMDTLTHGRMYRVQGGWVGPSADLGAAKELMQRVIEPQFVCCPACTLVSIMDCAMPATI